MDVHKWQPEVLIWVLLCDLDQVSSPLWAPDSSSVKWVGDLNTQVHLKD